jgi:hypothetical protein
MPRKKIDSVKAATLRERKSKGKIVEWEARVYSRGIRDVPVDIGPMASPLKPRKKALKRPTAENDDALQGETAPQPMDIDEAFWVEEPDMPTREKRVRQLTCPSSANLTHPPDPALLY